MHAFTLLTSLLLYFCLPLPSSNRWHPHHPPPLSSPFLPLKMKRQIYTWALLPTASCWNGSGVFDISWMAGVWEQGMSHPLWVVVFFFFKHVALCSDTSQHQSCSQLSLNTEVQSITPGVRPILRSGLWEQQLAVRQTLAQHQPQTDLMNKTSSWQWRGNRYWWW